MDPTSQGTGKVNFDAKQRFESFRLGKSPAPSQTVANPTRPSSSHGRSHSRNASVSSSVSSVSHSTSASPGKSSNESSSTSSGPSKRPNSHHRRRSSVSTRRESAEMMGVSVPELPTSLSDDNINLGDKDSIRRRALWALEGKPDVSYSKVEIPELSTLETEKKPFEFPSKPSFPPGTGAVYSGGPLVGKRDSFKLLASSSSSKDQLHTLVEEEEEEEEPREVDLMPKNIEEPASSITPTVAVTNPTPARPRPANLNLRPLSLTPDNLVSKFHGLPTPPNTASSLKSLSLNPATAFKSFLCTNNGDDSVTKVTTNAMKRQSLVLTPSPTPSTGTVSRRPVTLCDSPSPTPSEQDMPKRQSSISYKNSYYISHSAAGLPTPDLTPTSERRHSSFSSSSTEDDLPCSRPLSATEQHFLFKSHQALLARINDLERTLSSRTRPLSSASDTSSNPSSEPTDEILQLVTDLKSERDELKRDVDGWRTRVGDLENHIGIYAKRVEAERRDAWVARSRVTLLDVEKSALEKMLDEKTRLCHDAWRKCDELKCECDGLRAALEKIQSELNSSRESEGEYRRLRAAFVEEKQRREELEKEVRKLDPLATPTAPAFSTQEPCAPGRSSKRGLGFTSLDSESSTDVEESDVWKSVAEEAEDPDAELTDEDDELARYEDEEDSDVSFQSGSSMGSLDDFHRAARIPTSTAFTTTVSGTSSRPNPPSTSIHHPIMVARPTHHNRASLSKTWTFPRGFKAIPNAEREEVDHFFGCLGDSDVSPPLNFAAPTYEHSKGLFSQGFKAGSELEDDMPPIFLPCDVGVEVADIPKSILDIVVEEDEDDEAEDEDFNEDFEVGGIKITFTPPQPETSSFESENSSNPTPVRKPVTAYSTFFEDNDEQPATSFNFGRPVSQQAESSQSKPTSPEANKLDSGRWVASPSSIPRATSLKSTTADPTVTHTPPKNSLGRFIPSGTAGFVTPPTKRGGTIPSFIPQPVSSPLRSFTPPKQRVNPCSTFIPQPPRKSAPEVSSSKTSSSATNGSTFKPRLAMSISPAHLTSRSSSPPSEMSGKPLATLSNIPINEYPQDKQVSPPTSLFSIMSSPLAAQLSTFIPLSWAVSQVRPVAAAASCLMPESSSTSGSVANEPNGGHSSSNPKFKGGCNAVEKTKGRFVTKEEQLKKLRTRLYISKGTPDSCKNCKGGMVSF